MNHTSNDKTSNILVSRRRATIANLVYQYVTLAFAIINGIVLVPLYLKFIDITLFGAWLATGNIITWLTLVDPGFGDVLRQRTAQTFGKGDNVRLGKIIGTGSLLVIALGLLPGMIGLLGAPFVSRIFELSSDHQASIANSFIIAGIASSVTMMSGAAGAIQQGLQRNVAFTAITVTASLLGLATTIIGLYQDWGLVSIPLGWLIRAIVLLSLNWADVVVNGVLKYNLAVRFCSAHFSEIANLTGWTSLSRVGIRVFDQCDALVVSLLLGVEAAAVAVFTKRTWDLLVLFLQRISVAFMPGMAHLHGEGQPNAFKHIANRMITSVGSLTMIGVSCCLVLNHQFIELWVGPEMYAGSLYDIGMAVSVMLMVFVLSVKQILFAANIIKAPSIAALGIAVLRAITLFACVSYFGYIGVPLSLIVSYSVGLIAYFAPAWFSISDLSQKRTWHMFATSAIPLLATIVVGYFLTNNTTAATTWTNFSLVLFVLLTTATTFVLLLNPDIRSRVIGWLQTPAYDRNRQV